MRFLSFEVSLDLGLDGFGIRLYGISRFTNCLHGSLLEVLCPTLGFPFLAKAMYQFGYRTDLYSKYPWLVISSLNTQRRMEELIFLS